MQEAETQGPASQEENGSQPAAGESGTGKKSPKQAALDPGAYPGKESVGFLCESPYRTAFGLAVMRIGSKILLSTSVPGS